MEQNRSRPDIEVKELVKIYPFVKVGIFARKKQKGRERRGKAMLSKTVRWG